MNAVRIFLLVLIIIGIGLLLTQNSWVPSLVNWILRQEDQSQVTQQTVHQISTTSDATAPSVSHTKLPPPVAQVTGTLVVSVTLAPTCPVERIPPDPQCAPKPYVSAITVLHPDSTQVIATGETNNNGDSTFMLAPGMYEVEVAGGTTYPRCSPVTTNVVTGTSTAISIVCDTGIR